MESKIHKASDLHGSAQQHITRCTLRQPLESLVHEDQQGSLREIVRYLALHASKVSDTESIALISALLKVAKTKVNGEAPGKIGSEVHKLIMQALGCLLTDGKLLLPASSLRDAAAYLCDSLAEQTSDSQPAPDRATSHHLYGTLRLLQAIIPQAKEKQVISLSGLLDSLRNLFSYGVWPVAQSSSISWMIMASFITAYLRFCRDNRVSCRPSAYQPPHARRRYSQNIAPSAGSSPSSRRPSDSWRYEDGGYSSASDASDSESGCTGSKPSANSHVRVRLAAVSCLQALAKLDSKALHPFWAVLLPVHAPLARRPQSFTLMDAIVSDPAPKVRAAAASAVASLLEGAPQRAYLGIAECRLPAKQPVRGFTTLSATLGSLALSLHDGLLQAAANEADPAALTAVLRALCVLIGSAPYPRLPPTLLPRTLLDVHRCCTRLHSGARKAEEGIAAAQAAALSCIAAALNADASRGDLSELLYPDSAAQSAQPQGSDFGARLADDLVNLPTGAPSLVRTEALSALQALAVSHWALIGDHWRALRTAMLSSLEIGGEERCALNALRLLGSYLKAHADAGQSGSATCEAPCTLSGRGLPLVEEWRDALASIIPKGMEHPVAAIRAAAMSALAFSDQKTCVALSEQELQRIWGWLLSSPGRDPAAAVRAAALKTVGSLAQLELSLLYPGAAAMLGMISAGLRDTVLSVQIAAAWALANLADVITQKPLPDQAQQRSLIAEAALGAANAGDKVRANAVRAIGYVVAAEQQSIVVHTAQSRPCTHVATAGRSQIVESDAADVSLGSSRCADATAAAAAVPGLPVSQEQLNSSQHNSSLADIREGTNEGDGQQQRHICPDEGDKVAMYHGGEPPGWFERGLGCLREALATGNGKVQWNACYAIGALLRRTPAAAAANACGGLLPLLAQLLHVLQHSANFKTRMHAAAALCAVRDAQLLTELQPDVVFALKSALQALDCSHTQAAEASGTARQDTLENLQSLYPLKEQLHATLQHVEELLERIQL